jgi:hypothetical protein
LTRLDSPSPLGVDAAAAGAALASFSRAGIVPPERLLAALVVPLARGGPQLLPAVASLARLGFLAPSLLDAVDNMAPLPASPVALRWFIYRLPARDVRLPRLPGAAVARLMEAPPEEALRLTDAADVASRLFLLGAPIIALRVLLPRLFLRAGGQHTVTSAAHLLRTAASLALLPCCGGGTGSVAAFCATIAPAVASAVGAVNRAFDATPAGVRARLFSAIGGGPPLAEGDARALRGWLGAHAASRLSGALLRKDVGTLHLAAALLDLAGAKVEGGGALLRVALRAELLSELGGALRRSRAAERDAHVALLREGGGGGHERFAPAAARPRRGEPFPAGGAEGLVFRAAADPIEEALGAAAARAAVESTALQSLSFLQLLVTKRLGVVVRQLLRAGEGAAAAHGGSDGGAGAAAAAAVLAAAATLGAPLAGGAPHAEALLRLGAPAAHEVAAAPLYYFLDVAWPAARLAVEVDGPWHYSPSTPTELLAAGGALVRMGAPPLRAAEGAAPAGELPLQPREHVRRRALALSGWRVVHVSHAEVRGAALRPLLPLRAYPFLECTGAELAMDEGAIAARLREELGWDDAPAAAATARALRAVKEVDTWIAGAVVPRVLGAFCEGGAK